MRIVRAAMLALMLLGLAGCSCGLTEPSYRFELSFDSAPSAYRNTGAAQEQLVVAMWIRNVAAGNLCVSGPAAQGGIPEGLTVEARLISANEYISASQAAVSYGLRAGGRLRGVDAANESPIGDRHNSAVKDFAAAAPYLIGLGQDQALTSFRLLGNETLVLLTFPINWSAVPTSSAAVESSLAVEIALGYNAPKGTVLRFSERFRHRLQIYLLNAVRGFRDKRPSADSPKTGVFAPVSP